MGHSYQIVRVGIGISSTVSNGQAVWTMVQALTDNTIPHFINFRASTPLNTIQHSHGQTERAWIKPCKSATYCKATESNNVIR
jgi:hypothetical protein